MWPRGVGTEQVISLGLILIITIPWSLSIDILDFVPVFLMLTFTTVWLALRSKTFYAAAAVLCLAFWILFIYVWTSAPLQYPHVSVVYATEEMAILKIVNTTVWKNDAGRVLVTHDSNSSACIAVTNIFHVLASAECDEY